jgi:hypothetical protein
MIAAETVVCPIHANNSLDDAVRGGFCGSADQHVSKALLAHMEEQMTRRKPLDQLACKRTPIQHQAAASVNSLANELNFLSPE